MWVVGVWPLSCVGLSHTSGDKVSEGLSVELVRNNSDTTGF